MLEIEEEQISQEEEPIQQEQEEQPLQPRPQPQSEPSPTSPKKKSKKGLVAVLAVCIVAGAWLLGQGSQEADVPSPFHFFGR